jgi:uncharacterized protein YjbI with pentapeptide repeats
MRQPDYFLINLKADQTIDLKTRWKTQPEWISLQETVRSALADGGGLPADLPMIEAEFGGGIIKLVDLRGIDLSNLSIGKIVLAYCCFDFADFAATRFESTYLQYSSMAEARFNSSNWNKVQASPISAIRASFVGAHIHKSFLMRSNLDGVIFRNSTITNTALTGSVLGSARLSGAEHLNKVDITEVSLDSEQEVAQLRTNCGVVGLPKGTVSDLQKWRVGDVVELSETNPSPQWVA